MAVVEKNDKENKKIQYPLESVTPSTIAIEESIREGIIFILQHFTQLLLWPRTVSTRLTNNRQVPVYNLKQALELYKKADHRDCRINAYPYHIQFKGINTQEPNFIFIGDLDSSKFQSSKDLEAILKKACKNIAEDIGGYPTVIWSGNGYHIYQPILSPLLESESQFARFDRPSTELLRYAEYRFTKGKTDPCHNATVSLKNCMLRIPWSINSKNGQQIRIIQRWNGVRPAINPILFDFYIYLANKKITEQQYQKKLVHTIDKGIFGSKQNNIAKTPYWIDMLLNTGLHDHRKYTITFILAPYLINIKNRGYIESFTIIQNWLYGKSEPLRQLDSPRRVFDRRIKDSLDSCMKKGWKPLGLGRLKHENKRLFDSIIISCFSTVQEKNRVD